MRKEKGFSFFRMAFRNVVRMPGRSLLYLAVLTVLTIATFFGVFLLRATDNALLYLYDHYKLYVSVTPRIESDASGSLQYRNDTLSVDEIKMVISSPYVLNYSQTVSGAVVVFHGTLEEMTNIEWEDDVESYWSQDRLLYVQMIHDINMTRDYVNGNMKIIEGRAVEGENDIILPIAYCEKNGIKIGDTVVVRLTGDGDRFGKRYYAEYTVVGIFSGYNSQGNAVAQTSLEYSKKLVTEATGDSGDVSHNRRYELLLKSPDSIDGFLRYLNDNGFDFMRFMISFNDAEYNSAVAEIESVKSIVRIVFYTVLFVCVGLVVFLTVYFISNRFEEKATLHALGMKKCSVNAIFCLELVFILIVASVIGTGIGYGVSGVLVKTVETGTAKKFNIEEKPIVEDDATLGGYIGAVNSKPEIKFLMSYTPDGEKDDAKKLYGETAYIENGVYKTYETMYDSEGKAYRVFGSGELTTGQILEGGFKNGVTIDCLVPETSGLKRGDVLSLHLFPPKTVLCMDYPEKYYVSRFAVNFRVVGLGGEDDITVAFDNLLALTRYVTGSVFE